MVVVVVVVVAVSGAVVVVPVVSVVVVAGGGDWAKPTETTEANTPAAASRSPAATMANLDLTAS